MRILTVWVKVSSVMNSILLDCEALANMFNKKGLDGQIGEIVNKIEMAGNIFVTGIGKSGIVAQRMAASLNSMRRLDFMRLNIIE